MPPMVLLGFFGGSEGKESACNVGDLGSILRQKDSLEKGMTTHSSILAWRIPLAETPRELQSMESKKSWTQLSKKHFHTL